MVPYYVRVAILEDVLEAGALGEVELDSLHFGKPGRPLQVLLRNRITLRVFLIDLCHDGAITVDKGPYEPPPD
jgi:hypothetical protein